MTKLTAVEIVALSITREMEKITNRLTLMSSLLKLFQSSAKLSGSICYLPFPALNLFSLSETGTILNPAYTCVWSKAINSSALYKKIFAVKCKNDTIQPSHVLVTEQESSQLCRPGSPLNIFIVVFSKQYNIGVCSAQTVTTIGLFEEIPRSGVQIPCLS